MKTCAIIPAAGRGSRLGIQVPKILAPITATETVWSILSRKLLALVDHLHVVVSPKGYSFIRDTIGDTERISLSIQHQPLGMGDAIFGAANVWMQAETVLIVWGDQVFVSKSTLTSVLAKQKQHSVVLPLTKTSHPYVEYLFENDKLCQIKQTREGDTCSAGGLSDVGTFVISTKGLLTMWQQYRKIISPGKATSEINFLPFLIFLSAQNWEVTPVLVADAREARGINTPCDLLYFQNLFSEKTLCDY